MILVLSIGIAVVTLAILYTMFEIQINITSLEYSFEKLKAHEKEKA
jgi:cell division protein FtsL